MNEEFKIEKGVPLPTKHPGNRWGRGAKWARLIRSMEIGDSVLLRKPPMPGIYKTCRRNVWNPESETRAATGPAARRSAGGLWCGGRVFADV